jgi:hypothetical protein
LKKGGGGQKKHTTKKNYIRNGRAHADSCEAATVLRFLMPVLLFFPFHFTQSKIKLLLYLKLLRGADIKPCLAVRWGRLFLFSAALLFFLP